MILVILFVVKVSAIFSFLVCIYTTVNFHVCGSSPKMSFSNIDLTSTSLKYSEAHLMHVTHFIVDLNLYREQIINL